MGAPVEESPEVWGESTAARERLRPLVAIDDLLIVKKP
jgi:hypothetical protein